MAELVGRRYAGVLYEAAMELNMVDNVSEEIKYISELYTDSKEFRLVLEHPRLSKIEKKDILKKLFTSQLSEIMLNFLYLLIDKGRGRNIVGIYEAFEEKYLDEKGIVRVDALTAIPLEDSEKQQLIDQLSKKMGKEIRLKNTVTEEIVGGVLLKMNDQVIDHSIKGALAALRQSLIEKRL
jgi:F-type H+-transporting ATPase subunit delta